MGDPPIDSKSGTVDVSLKPSGPRRAVAEAVLTATSEAIAAIQKGSLPKGEALATARAAALLATKRTAGLIPHCHPLALTSARVDFEFSDASVTVRCEVKACDRTGPEMEALCGAAIGALTLYDTVKAVCRGARIAGTYLVEKEGGKSGHWRAGEGDG